MQHIEAKAGRFHIVLVAAAALAALVSCGDGWLGNPPPPPEASENVAPEIGYNNGDVVAVKVKLPQKSQSAARSISPDAVEHFVDSYEAVFRKIGDPSPANDLYYRGEGTAGQGYISVAVPVGGPYEVLLLAGIGRILVGGGYLGRNNSADDKDAGKGPVNIEAGKANVIAIEVAAFPPQWDTNCALQLLQTPPAVLTGDAGDFSIQVIDPYAADANGPPPAAAFGSIEHRYIHLKAEAVASPYFIFCVCLELDGFTPLILADAMTTGALPFGANTKITFDSEPVIRLQPRYIYDWFSPMDFTTPLATFSVLDDNRHTYTLATPVLAGLNYNSQTQTFIPLPQKHVDGLIRFEMKYRAFGAPKSFGGRTWTIKNGLYNTPDDQPEFDGAGNATGGGVGMGSYFPIRFGDGTPEHLKGLGTIVYVD